MRGKAQGETAGGEKARDRLRRQIAASREVRSSARPERADASSTSIDDQQEQQSSSTTAAAPPPAVAAAAEGQEEFSGLLNRGERIMVANL